MIFRIFWSKNVSYRLHIVSSPLILTSRFRTCLFKCRKILSPVLIVISSTFSGLVLHMSFHFRIVPTVFLLILSVFFSSIIFLVILSGFIRTTSLNQFNCSLFIFVRVEERFRVLYSSLPPSPVLCECYLCFSHTHSSNLFQQWSPLCFLVSIIFLAILTSFVLTTSSNQFFIFSVVDVCFVILLSSFLILLPFVFPTILRCVYLSFIRLS